MKSRKEEYLNKEFTTKEGYTLKVVNYVNNKKVQAEFLDTKLVIDTTIRNLSTGEIKNPYHKTVYGKGFYGVGQYTARVQKHKTPAYIKWYSMMTRCYNPEYHIKESSYIDCEVCKEWLNFQNFAKWFYENNQKDYELDKDLLVKGNKIYSPNTCCFIPKKLNNLLNLNKKVRSDLPIGVYRVNNTQYSSQLSIYGKLEKGVVVNSADDAFLEYKTKKEKYVKELAEKFKNQIKNLVYEALNNYKVEIND